MFVCQYESNNCPCGPVGKNPLIPDDSPWFELLMRRMLIYFVTFFTYIRTSKVFHFYLFFLDGNYRVFFTSQNTRKIPYSLNPVKIQTVEFWHEDHTRHTHRVLIQHTHCIRLLIDNTYPA